MSDNYITIGKIISTHGNKGEIKVFPLTDQITRFKKLKSVIVGRKALKILNSRIIKNVVIILLILNVYLIVC